MEKTRTKETQRELGEKAVQKPLLQWHPAFCAGMQTDLETVGTWTDGGYYQSCGKPGVSGEAYERAGGIGLVRRYHNE